LSNVFVKILADYFEGKPVHENVPAVKLGENRYRISASPGLAPGIAAGDEIELLPSERAGYRVTKRGGNVCVQLFLNACDSEDRIEITNLVRSIGGWLDGGSDAGSGFLLIYTIPVTAGFSAIQNVMAQVSQRFSVDKWMYGNVYDTKDGVTPLNWWLHI
jgi:hypothetical protein